jgi:ABC-2 type transport system ATP-binding protein
VLDVRDVSKRFGDKVALDGVELRIGAGEIVSLLGPNGAGKTTLVSIVAGLLRPDTGQVLVSGVDPARDPRGARRHLGLVPQDLGVYPSLSVRDNLVFFGELAGLRRAALAEAIDEVAGALRLDEFVDRPVRYCSGGEKRRLHTAVALMHRPAVLLLDEPTAGLDVDGRVDLVHAVRKLAADGTAICYSTHYLEEVETLGASVELLDAGRIIASGPVVQLVGEHARPTLEIRFDGACPDLDGRWPHEVCGSTLRVFCDEPAAQVGAVLRTLDGDAHRVQSIEVVDASLEAVFLKLTGRRYESQGAEPDVVVA